MTNFQAFQTSNLKRQPISKISLGHIIPPPPHPTERIRVNIESSSTGIKNVALNNEFDLRSFKHYHHRIRRFLRGYTAKAFWKSNVQLYSQNRTVNLSYLGLHPGMLFDLVNGVPPARVQYENAANQRLAFWNVNTVWVTNKAYLYVYLFRRQTGEEGFHTKRFHTRIFTRDTNQTIEWNLRTFYVVYL